MTDQNERLKVGVISAGPTAQVDRLTAMLPARVELRTDFHASELPDDLGLLDFITMLHQAAPEAASQRPPSFIVLGAVDSRAWFVAALRQLIGLRADLIVFWTMSPLTLAGPPDGEDAFDGLLAQAVADEIAIVCPAGTGLARRNDGVFTASGVVANGPFLETCPLPGGWPADPALVAGWGDMPTFRNIWANAGVPLPTPKFPQAGGHTLAVWSLATALVANAASRSARPSLGALRSGIGRLCVPISTRPDASGPTLGLLEPRRRYALSLWDARMAASDADARNPLEDTHPGRHEIARVALAMMGATGRGATVAVIDSGIDPDYLAKRALRSTPNVVAHDFTRGKEGWKDEGVHWPHGSRIIGDILESAPETAMHSLRVHGATQAEDASRDDVVRALEWCGRNGVNIVNLSLNFYHGCSTETPCILCRSVNSLALTTGMFIGISAGDAITVGQAIAAKEDPYLCPLQNARVAWGVASQEVLTPARVLLEREGAGLSFTTGKFTAGIAQLYGMFPRLDLFATRYYLEQTCVPYPRVPPTVAGYGRHSVLLAWLAMTGRQEPTGGVLDLGQPSAEAAERGIDRGVLRALRLIAFEAMAPQRWDEATPMLAKVLERIEPWAGPGEKFLAHYMYACCCEATGDDAAARAGYDAAVALVAPWASAIEAGAAQ